MSTNYYLTGRSRTVNVELTFSGDLGRAEFYSPYRQYTNKYNASAIIPLFSDNILFGLDDTLQNFVIVINNQIFASYAFTGIQTINMSLTYSCVLEEAVVIETLQNQYYDGVNKIDYPLKRRMRIVEIIKDRNLQISATINGNTTTANRYINLLVVSNYEGILSCDQSTSIFVVPSNYNNLTLECNTTSNLKVNNISYFDISYNDSDQVVNVYTQPPPTNFQTTQYGSISVNGTLNITTRSIANGLLIYNPVTVQASVQSYIRVKQSKELDLLCKIYNLDAENEEDVTINIFNEDITMRHSFSRFYNNIKPYEYSYTCITKNNHVIVNDERYDLVKINSNAGRFMFRTFLYDAISQLDYSNEVDVGNYLNENHYVPIDNCSVVKDGNTIKLLVSNSANNAICRYLINGEANDFYLDSHRYLVLRLSAHASNTVNVLVKINNKQYNLAIDDLTTTPKDYYIDLCKPSNATQTIDYKNNNFDEDDSYADYWGITKTKQIDIHYDKSFVLHSIKLKDSLPNEPQDNDNQKRFHRCTVLGQRSTWQNNKRRVFVVRNRGKQTLELPDALENREITINEVIEEINSNRWNGWQATKHNYSQCTHSGNIHNLVPCLLNLNTPASFLCGCGNTYDGTNDVNYVNKPYVNQSQYKAQFLVDEIEFYPDCGDVFFDTNNNNRSGAIKLYASLIRRAQANGLVKEENNDVMMYNFNGSHNAGADKSDFYQFYYIVGDYAKRDIYKVEPVGSGVVAEKDCFDANEYRICFNFTTPSLLIIHDIDYDEGILASTTNIQNADGLFVLMDNNLDQYYRLNEVYSSCDLRSKLILTAQSYLFSHSFALKSITTLKSLGNYMYPFVISYNGELYITYYDTTNKNFVFEKYDLEMNLQYRAINIIDTVPSNGEIPEQNFPITVSEGLIIGVFMYQVGGDKRIQFVSSTNGKRWVKQKEIVV